MEHRLASYKYMVIQQADMAGPVPFDWDNDGVLDLPLDTYAYLNKKAKATSISTKVKQNEEYRFEKGVPLFTAKDEAVNRCPAKSSFHHHRRLEWRWRNGYM